MLRNLVLLVFSAILVACAEVKEVTADQLVERDGITYEKFSSEPFTGRVSGELEFGAYKNGLKTGPWEIYHENGQISGRWEFVAGELDGMGETYRENGQLWSRGEYVNDNRNGIWERYSADGELEIREVWEDGELVSSTGVDDYRYRGQPTERLIR